MVQRQQWRRIRLLNYLGKIRFCQVFPDTKEECPAYLAGLANVDIRGIEEVNKRCPLADTRWADVQGKNCYAGVFITTAKQLA